MSPLNDPSEIWPTVLWIVRHGESAGNIAREAALAARRLSTGIDIRDVDVPLSPRGEQQAAALGHWFRVQPPDGQPTMLLTSPYERAHRTATILVSAAGFDHVPIWIDERLREKEFGVLDGLTGDGIVARQPEQATLRRFLGKFYHRPPGGESWTDVILRLRTLIDTISHEYPGERLLIVAHSVVVLCFRYILEHMTESELLALDVGEEVANGSLTTYVLDPHQGRRGALVLKGFNFVPAWEHRTSTT
ncbi:MAG TPA: histidine phosphatase family protein [Gemmatimonadaceae bacterium]|nr:histidine phosphatase family protein [Gemmatimonadaceae bacterium]